MRITSCQRSPGCGTCSVLYQFNLTLPGNTVSLTSGYMIRSILNSKRTLSSRTSGSEITSPVTCNDFPSSSGFRSCCSIHSALTRAHKIPSMKNAGTRPGSTGLESNNPAGMRRISAGIPGKSARLETQQIPSKKAIVPERIVYIHPGYKVNRYSPFKIFRYNTALHSLAWLKMRSFFKRYIPEQHIIREHRLLRYFGKLLHDPNIWHLTRRSTAGGVATGFFCAYIPLPIHMVVAAALSILFRVNLPIAVICTWITNPFTFAPIFIFAYELGAKLLNRPARELNIELSLQWLTERLVIIWEPLLLGCLILAVISSLAGYFSIRLLWRISAVRKWEERKSRMQNKKQ